MQLRQLYKLFGKCYGTSILLLAYCSIPKCVVVWIVLQSLQLLQGSTLHPLPV